MPHPHPPQNAIPHPPHKIRPYYDLPIFFSKHHEAPGGAAMWWCFDSLKACRVGGNDPPRVHGGPEIFGFGLEKKWRNFFYQKNRQKVRRKSTDFCWKSSNFLLEKFTEKKTDWLGQIDWKKRLTGMEISPGKEWINPGDLRKAACCLAKLGPISINGRLWLGTVLGVLSWES